MSYDDKSIVWRNVNLFTDQKEVVDRLDSDDPDDEFAGMNISKISVTPMGPVSLSDDNHPFRDVHFSIANTNFDITEDSMRNIAKVAGVEYLRVISRYRFIIGIAVLFNASDVKLDIMLRLGVGKEENTAVSAVITALEKKYAGEDWIGYIFPNGVVVDTKVVTEADLENAMTKYTELQKLSGGAIIP